MADGQLTQALIVVRRHSRCDSRDGRLFLSELARTQCDWAQLARDFPFIVAPLCHDPAAPILRRLEPRRRELLRLLRRKRRLEALRLIQSEAHIEAADARVFCAALEARHYCWDQVIERYLAPAKALKGDDFFSDWPPPSPPQKGERDGLGIFSPPETLTPEILIERVRVGDIRSAMLLVRRFGRVEADAAQHFVNDLDDLLLDEDPDLWGELERRHPSLFAALAGEPDPLWLEKLHPIGDCLLDLLQRGRRLEAVRKVADACGGTHAEIRRFLEQLAHSASDSPPAGDASPRPAEPPSVPKAAPVPPRVQTPTSACATPPQARTRTERASAPAPTPAAPAPLPSKSQKAPGSSEAGLAAPTPQERSCPQCRATGVPISNYCHHCGAALNFDPKLSAAVPVASPGPSSPSPARPIVVAPLPTRPPDLKFDSLDDLRPHLDTLILLLDSQGPEQARAFFRQLEAAGFNRAWAAATMPALASHLPPEPWADRLPELLPLLRDLQGWITRGGIPSELLLKAPLQKASQALGVALDVADLEQLYDDVQDCLSSGKISELEPSLSKLLGTPRGEKELRSRVPMLAALFPDKPITLEALRALKGHPQEIVLSLLKRKNPKLFERLDQDKLARLIAGWPDLKDWMKRRQFHKASAFLFRELGLGPSDISDFFKVVRELL